MKYLDLTLDSLKFANVYGFSRTYGTKKDSMTNGGSLTTKEFNEANALPFDLQRPVEINETTTINTIQYDAKLNITAINTIVLNIGDGTYPGQKVDVYNTSSLSHTISFNGKNYSIEKNQTVTLVWKFGSWNSRTVTKTFTERVGTIIIEGINASVSEGAVERTASIDGINELYDGLTVRVMFTSEIQSSGAITEIDLNINQLGPKPIMAKKDNSFIKMYSHEMISGSDFDATHPHRWCDKGINFELVYLSSAGDDGAWVVMGNPEVMSGTSSDGSASYSVKANGWIEQNYIGTYYYSYREINVFNARSIIKFFIKFNDIKYSVLTSYSGDNNVSWNEIAFAKRLKESIEVPSRANSFTVKGY